eukprot:TRINITY_DN1559_c0_g1_i1.p1 TRINITY_DN1559_c0_g1~~TRINITY_DN1559_c0_g1_i1.p1  ORF type:complete len:374 (+),score=74.95 TRINITY_DN1559_c0_g1_i1:81-1202(+)
MSDESAASGSVRGWTGSVLKKQQRDLSRFLSKVGSTLPEPVRQSKAALLAAVESEIKRRAEGGERDASVVPILPGGGAGPEKKNSKGVSAAKASKKTKKSSGPDYKKIRFIEKTKVQKLILALEKQLRKVNHDVAHAAQVNPPLSAAEIEALQASQAKLSAELQSRRVDLLYTVHFPKDDKYISLFPPSPYTNEAVKNRQAEIRQQISDKYMSGSQSTVVNVSAQTSRLLDEKRDSRKQRKELLRQLKAEQQGEDEDSSESSDAPISEPKPVGKPKLKPVAQRKLQPARPIRRDEDSSEDERPQKATKRSKDDFFLSGDDDTPAVAPQEYLADLRPLNEWENGDDDAPAAGGKKRKRLDGESEPERKSKLRKR